MAASEHPELITHAQAAEILGCGVSNIPKLIRAGRLQSHGRRGPSTPSLQRADVKELAETRNREAAERNRRRDSPPPEQADRRPEPINGHGWLTAPEAAKVIGVSAQAVRRRCRKGTIPHLQQGGRWWIREDHARLAEHVRATNSQRRPRLTGSVEVIENTTEGQP